MAECSGSRFKPLDKPIEEYITDKQKEKKNTRLGCEGTYCFSAGEKRRKKN